jgi:hypothetical protein
VQQGIGVLALVAGAEVVGALVEVGIDLAEGDEVVDLDAARLRAGRRRDLLVGQLDPLAPAHLVALDDVVVVDLLVVLGADAPVLDRAAVLGVDLAEVDGLGLGGRVDLDRHGHEAEGDGAVPDRARGHGRCLPTVPVFEAMSAPALIVIDVQKAFADPYWGRRDNPGCEGNVAALIERWREQERPIVFVRHDSDEPVSPLRPGLPGNEFQDVVTGEPDLLVTM